MYKYDRYTTAAATWCGRYWMHTVVSKLSFTKLFAACKKTLETMSRQGSVDKQQQK